MRFRMPARARAPLCGLACAAWVACLAGVPISAGAQEKPSEKPDEQEKQEKAERDEFLDDAKNYAIRTVGKPEVALKMLDAPVLNFTNPERNQERGAVFVWLNEGRPAVMGQFFRYSGRTARVKKHALHSLADVELEAKFRDKLAWTPEAPGVEWKSFPDAPTVAANQKERVRQIKQLVEPFKVNLIDSKDKVTELRRVQRPLYEYSAPKVGVLDGAIFSYVVATDPEAILLVEAFDEKGKTGFRYAFARFHFWKLNATLNDKPVWEAAYDGIMMHNTIGKPETIKKVYNSFVP
jgi:hypothetical protein